MEFIAVMIAVAPWIVFAVLIGGGFDKKKRL